MDYLGMLCLGGFVGGILCLGLNHATTLNDFTKVVVFIFASSLSGGVFGFIQFYISKKTQVGLPAYPVGLALALLWYYASSSVELIKQETIKPEMRALAWWHIWGVGISTALTLVLVLPPAFKEAWTAKDRLELPTDKSNAVVSQNKPMK